MSKNLEELKKLNSYVVNETKDYTCGFPLKLLKILIPLFGDFEKRLTELEKYKNNILEHQEINETGGASKIKIVLDDPILKKERGIR